MSKVDYTISMTPLTTVSASAGSYGAHDVINADIGKTLTANAEVTVDTAAHTTVGYGTGTAGVVAYVEAADGAKTQLGADNTAYDFVYIKNTGYVYSSATALGAATAIYLDVFIEKTAGSAYIEICSLPPGAAIALPNFPAQGSSLGIHVQPASGSIHIAVEYALIT